MAKHLAAMGSMHKFTIASYRSQLSDIEKAHGKEVQSIGADAHQYRRSLKGETETVAERHAMALEDTQQHQTIITHLIEQQSYELLEKHAMEAEEIATHRLLRSERVRLQTQEAVESRMMHREDFSTHLEIKKKLEFGQLAEEAEQHKMMQEDQATQVVSVYANVRDRSQIEIEQHKMALEDSGEKLLGASALMRRTNTSRVDYHASQMDKSIIEINTASKDLRDKTSEERARQKVEAERAAAALSEGRDEAQALLSTRVDEHQVRVEILSSELAAESMRAAAQSAEMMEISMMALEDLLHQSIQVVHQAFEASKQTARAVSEKRERELMNNEDHLVWLLSHHENLRDTHENAAALEQQKLSRLRREHSEAVER